MIYLASTSPRRKALLTSLRIPFKVIQPDYEEKLAPPRTSPSMVVKKHALRKAVSVAKKINEGIIVGADTVVYFRGRIVGKPRSLKEAAKILGALEGRWHTVYTGVALLKVRRQSVEKQAVFFETTKIRLKKMGPGSIEDYFKKVHPLDKAGAYAIQSTRHPIVEKVRGSYTNAVGLPVEKLYVKLKKF